MKKFLFIANIGRDPDGSFFHAFRVAAQRVGYEFHVAYNWFDRTDEKIAIAAEKGIHFHQIDFVQNPFHPGNIIAYRQLLKLLKEHRFDVVNANTSLGGMIGCRAAKRANTPYIIYTVHGFLYYQKAPIVNRVLYKWLEMSYVKLAHMLITINNADFEYALSHNGRSRENVKYIHGVGINVNRYMLPQYSIDRSALGLTNNDKIILYTGNLTIGKNVTAAIKAISLLQDSNVHLLICGEGTERSHLVNAVDKLGCSANVHFLGYRTDVDVLLANTSVFLLPSYREGLSRSIMEAMAAGLPCVVSNIRGNTDLIDDGKGGYLCDPHKPAEFADALQHILEDDSLRLSMGAYNREKAKRYDVRLVINEVIEIFSHTYSD